MAAQPAPQFPTRLDRHVFAAMTDREFEIFCDLTEQRLDQAGPDATRAHGSAELPNLDPPF